MIRLRILIGLPLLAGWVLDGAVRNVKRMKYNTIL